MNYDDYDDFYGEDTAGYHPDADHEIDSREEWYDNIDDHDNGRYDDMDGDHESGFASAGWGVDESYRDDIDAYEHYYGEDY